MERPGAHRRGTMRRAELAAAGQSLPWICGALQGSVLVDCAQVAPGIQENAFLRAATRQACQLAPGASQLRGAVKCTLVLPHAA